MVKREPGFLETVGVMGLIMIVFWVLFTSVLGTILMYRYGLEIDLGCKRECCQPELY